MSSEPSAPTNIPSLKKSVVLSLYSLPGINTSGLPEDGAIDFAGLQLVIITSGCMITGKPLLDDYEPSSSEAMLVLIEASLKAAKKEHQDTFKYNGQLSGNDGGILLRDVTIRYALDYVVTMPALFVFFDQILAITVGDRT